MAVLTWFGVIPVLPIESAITALNLARVMLAEDLPPPEGLSQATAINAALIANSAEAEPTYVFRFIEISPVRKFFYWKDWCITGYLSTIEFAVRGAGAA